ncbi:MAG: choice-of-anchor D domain-containing protein [Acidobacteriia bacterium]|nr:choice-of-anchor D domain-containing protein [Terriglobia bacterium]
MNRLSVAVKLALWVFIGQMSLLAPVSTAFAQASADSVAFAAQRTRTPAVTPLIGDTTGDNPKRVGLLQSGAGSCTGINDCAYQLLNQRTSANRNNFFVYQDADSAFNHGLPILFGSIDLTKIMFDAGCIDAPGSPTGCSVDLNAMDMSRGTILRLTFPKFPLPEDFAGMNIQDPQNFDNRSIIGNGYDLTPATSIQFDVRSPDGAVVQFGVGGCVTNFFPVGQAWTTMSIRLDSLFPPPGDATAQCPPDIANTHILFGVAMSGAQSSGGGTVLLDNIQFTPVPDRQSTSQLALSLPLSTQTFGVKTQASTVIPTDLANRNVAAIYEAALTVLSLLKRGQSDDHNNALEIADALDYALHHDNQGGAIPEAPDGSGGLGLHSAYAAGDIALLNDQTPPAQGKAGNIRLAGFFGGTDLCPPTGFCEVLDGATGGNNAWGILAFAAAYLESGNPAYLNDAKTIGKWIIGALQDRTSAIPFPRPCLLDQAAFNPTLNPPGYGGYFLGYGDGSHDIICGKSTENNADIFAAFNLLAQIEAARGNVSAAEQWTVAANVAGDFVIQMFDSTHGRFFAGTVTSVDADPNKRPGRGSCPDISTQKGNDVINQCDFVDADSFIILAMAGSQVFGLGLAQPPLDWNTPLHYVLDLGNTIPDPPNNLNPPNTSGIPASFTQSVTVGPITFRGFDLIPAIPATGIAWEFTGQMAETCSFVDGLQNSTTFQNCVDTYLSQIAKAQNSAPFGDGFGLVASTLQDGDTLPPIAQCVDTPFQCIPERVGLAATNWAILAQQQFNPMAYGAAGFSPTNVRFPGQVVGTSSALRTVTLTNSGTLPLAITSLTISGANASEFKESDSCANSVLGIGKACAISVTFTPGAQGERNATLFIGDNGLGPKQVSLSGTGAPANDFLISAIPNSVSTVAGNSAVFNIDTTTIAGAPQAIAFTAAGFPSGVTSAFNPPLITSGQSTTLTVTTSVNTLPNLFHFTITGAGTSAVNTASATLEVRPLLSVLPAGLRFAPQRLGTTSEAQQVLVTNGGPSFVNTGDIAGGQFPGDFSISGCEGAIAPGISCTVSVTFSPTGTGERAATVLFFDGTGNNAQSVSLTGTGAASCASISDCAYQEMNQRASANQDAFFVYKDADSAFNHGFTALFGSLDLLDKITIDAGCLDSPASSIGCSSDLNALDGTRGTVFRITFPSIPAREFAGLSFQEPQNFDGQSGNSYNLVPASTVQFEARSPDNASVQFGVGGCVTPFMAIPVSWSTVTVSIASLVPPPLIDVICPPDISKTHILFSIGLDDAHGAHGGTVLVDNVRFTPLPARQKSSGTVSLPISTQTLGVIPKQVFPIPVDEAVRNLSTVEEAAVTAVSLLRRHRTGDIDNALKIITALDYALRHDNQGDSLPVASDGSVGLHSAYEGGDLALLNDQPPPEKGQTGNVRLAGFFAGKSLCGPSGFCEVLDGAFGGPNAWAMLAFETAYLESGNLAYLNDAETIGKWILGTLADNSSTGFGGYFVGFSDGGLPKVLTLGKSTEFNADIFAAFNLLAEIERARGNKSIADGWTTAANSAGNFVVNMFDSSKGRFFAGTVSRAFANNPVPGVCPDTSLTRGADVVSTCDSLTQNSFAILALAGSKSFGVRATNNKIDWTLPLLYVQDNFAQSVTTTDSSFRGFNLIPNTGGIAWEATAQTVATCAFVDALLNRTDFEDCGEVYLPQILQAQNHAPFGDGAGLVAATLQNGDTLSVVEQCIVTPFQCIPERVSLGATAWAALADQGLNPMAFAVTKPSAINLNFPSQLVSGSTSQTLTLTNVGTSPLFLISPIAIRGVNASDFGEVDTCAGAVIDPEGSCNITVTFTPAVFGLRTATLTIADNSLNAGQTVSLIGTGTDFLITADPASQQVNAGAKATYTLTINPLGGLNQTVLLTCKNDDTIIGSTCNLSTSSVALNGLDPATVVVTVTTTGPATSSSGFYDVRTPRLQLRPGLEPFWLAATLAVILLTILFVWKRTSKLRFLVILGVIVFCACYWAGCGGSSTPNVPPPQPPQGPRTAPGLYMLTIHGATGNRFQDVPLKLDVK